MAYAWVNRLFFGLGVVAAPLSRLILFATSVGKGTTSAFMSLLAMCIQAFGIEVANYIYATHLNVLFALYCAASGIIYFLFLMGTFGYIKETAAVLPIE